MPTSQETIRWALAEFDPGAERMVNYAAFCDYYDGMQPMAFASEKYTAKFWRIFKHFSMNLCASVIDVQTERLEVVAFTSSESEFSAETLTTTDKPGAKAWDAWELNRLDLVADKVHEDSLKVGDGFLIAQPSATGMTVWPQKPHQIAVHYSNDVPSVIDLAAKMFCSSLPGGDLEVWTLYIYEPGLVRKYTAEVSKDSARENLKPEKFNPAGSVTLPGKFMPVYHFPNRAMASYGVSELRDVLPLQDALNKTVMDMLVSSEYQAFRQRWATGAELDELPDKADPLFLNPHQVATDGDGMVLARADEPEHGPGTLTMFPNPETKVGEWGQADINPFLLAKNAFQADIARVSGVPLSYFFVSTSETPSGEALKTGETRFTRKGNRQKRSLGNHWEHVIAVIADISPSIDLNTIWDDSSSRSETEKLNALVLKETMGVPVEQLWKEMGYDDDQIAAFAEHRRAAQEQAANDAQEQALAEAEAKAASQPKTLPAASTTTKREQQPPSPQKTTGGKRPVVVK